MLNIVLFGPPGAGKGTQSEKLIRKYNLVHLSTGDILRGEIAAGTELGMQAKKLMDEGNLVPDDVVIGMISSRLDQNKDAKGFIFDGFPRTAAQAEALDRLLNEKNTEITMMLALEVDDEELTKRLLLRGEKSGRADDQNEDIIRNRVAEYNNKTAPLKDYYTAQNKFFSVHGIGEVEEIFENLSKAITARQDASDLREDADKPSLVSRIVEVVKDVYHAVTGDKDAERKTPARKDRKPMRKDSPSSGSAKKAAAKKKPAAKAPVKTSVKKAAKKVVKRTATATTVKKKVAGKTAALLSKKGKTAVKNSAKAAKKVQKPVKKAAKKVAKKVVKKVAKKVAKKIVKKTAKKIAKKVSAKKVAAKKVSRKPAAKVTAKRAVKKVAAKRPAKKQKPRGAASKKSTKKTAKRRK
jgi:adenylate kinase